MSDLSETSTLTDYRVHLASRVLKNIFSYKNILAEIIVTSKQVETANAVKTLLVGPVLNYVGKKDNTTTFQEYSR